MYSRFDDSMYEHVKHWFQWPRFVRHANAILVINVGAHQLQILQCFLIDVLTDSEMAWFNSDFFFHFLTNFMILLYFYHRVSAQRRMKSRQFWCIYTTLAPARPEIIQAISIYPAEKATMPVKNRVMRTYYTCVASKMENIQASWVAPQGWSLSASCWGVSIDAP